MKQILIYSILLFLASCTTKTASTKADFREEKEQYSPETQARATSIKVIDTDFSKGRLTNQQELTLWDVQKMHGHLCDGLVVGFLGLREGLYKLYPDSVIDRTNTRIVANSSPCIGDVAIYLTGGRYQFNSFYVDNAMNGIYIVQRTDNNQTVIIRLKNGVKPAEIDVLGAKAMKRALTGCGLDSLKSMEDRFTQRLFSGTPKDLFEIEFVPDFTWNPTLKNDFPKSDILNKNAQKCGAK